MTDLPAFYHPAEFFEGEALEIVDEQLRHLKALRLRPGDWVLVLDGRGVRAQAVIRQLDRHSAELVVGKTVLDNREDAPYIAAALGILDDRARFEWALEKAVELGAGAFMAVRTEHSEGHVQQARMKRVAVAALKQSRRSFLPDLGAPVLFPGLLEMMPSYDRCFICHERIPVSGSLAGVLRKSGSGQRVLLMVGPEGGFSQQEVAAAVAAGAQAVSLGPVRLRSETALVAALAVLSLGAL